MTMIRINLIAEKKQGTAKAAKKVTKQSAQAQQLQENGIIVGLVLLGLVIAFLLNKSYSDKASRVEGEVKALETEYEKIKVWEENQKEFEIRKQLLDQKIQKISALKEYRGGPIKILEDIYNNLPDNLWIESITSGINKDWVQKGESYRKILDLKQGDSPVPSEDMFSITGYARSADAITNFTKNLQALDTRYASVDLSMIDRNLAGSKTGKDSEELSGVYKFSIFIKLVNSNPTVVPDESSDSKSAKKKKT